MSEDLEKFLTKTQKETLRQIRQNRWRLMYDTVTGTTKIVDEQHKKIRRIGFDNYLALRPFLVQYKSQWFPSIQTYRLSFDDR